MDKRLPRAAVAALLLFAAIPGLCVQSRVSEVNAVLDDLHDAASKADFDRYFSHFTEDAVFLGTDPSERWTTPEFRVYVKARFEHGGWTYVPKERHVFFSKDGNTAWFDEATRSEKYGAMRGTGVLVRSGKTWRVAQYNLLKPIPNDLFIRVAEMVESQKPKDSNSAPIAAPHNR